MFKNRTLLMIVILLMGAMVTACQTGVVAQDAPSEAPESPYRIAITDTDLIVPADLPSGVVTLSYVNQSAGQQVADLARLKEGVTVEQFNTAMAGEDPMAAFMLVQWLGGVTLGPNATQEVIYELEPDQHVMIAFGDQGPQTAFTQVTSEKMMAQLPVPTIHAELTDFSLIIPDEIKAGRHTWQITNIGKQWHEMHIVKMNDGVTTQEVIEYLSQGPVPEGTPPFESIAFVTPLDPERSIWATFELEPGQYTVICALPDLITSHENSHASLGMVRQLTVSE